MKIGRLNISLARRPAPKNDQEVGTSAATSSGASILFHGEVINTDKVTVADLVKMRQEDGTASALYNIMTLPIMANPWDIEADPEDVDGVQAAFIKDAFSRPSYRGGMTTPFSLVVADALRAVLEGYRLFEKVYTINPEGKIVYRKIASRDNSTITLLSDDRGGFNGAKQRAYIGDKYDEVVIPRDKCFLFTFGKEKDWLKGESAFRAAFYHYDKKHRLYYLAHQAVQQFAITPKVGIAPAGVKNQADIDEAVDVLDSLAVNSSAALPNGWDVKTLGATGRIDPVQLIDHHNAEMARSILAQFMMLGSGGSTGSWALSNDQSDMFILALRGLMDNLEEHITAYLVADLIDYNFETPHYPKFRFADLTTQTTNLVKESFMKIMDKDPSQVNDFVIDGVVKRMAELLEIEIPEDKKTDDDQSGSTAADTQSIAGAIDQTAEIAKQALNGAQIGSLLDVVNQIAGGQLPFDTGRETLIAAFPFLTPADIDKILSPVKNFTPTPQLSRKKGRHFLADERWKRPLTPAETKVNFSSIQKKFNTLETEFEDKVKPIWDKIKSDTLARVEKLLEAEDYGAIQDLEINFADEYRAAIVDAMMDAYNYAKVGAADEMGVRAPQTPKETRDLINSQAQQTVDKQFAELKFEITNAVTTAQRKAQLSTHVDLAISDVIGTIGTLIGGYYDSKIGITAGIITTIGINIGRDDAFKANAKNISRYQYSAILDDATCAICEDLDGMVLNQQQYDDTVWTPPIHFNCRCIWVEILEDEEEQPEITGVPDSPGGTEAPALSEHYGHRHKAVA